MQLCGEMSFKFWAMGVEIFLMELKFFFPEKNLKNWILSVLNHYSENDIQSQVITGYKIIK